MIEARLRARFGAGVQPWLDALPDRVARLCAQWGLEPGEVFPTGNSAVTMRVARAGEPAVLKVSPEVDVLAEQAVVLAAYAERGARPRSWPPTAARS